MPTLPQPDAASALHSAAVAAHIRRVIEAAGGAISFAEFMHEALYAPALGYYTAGATKFGDAGDFVTAPEISPLFAAVLARQCAEVLHDVPRGGVLELGAGSGRLAVDLLRALERIDALPEAYSILEVSPELTERQAILLNTELPQLSKRVRWLSELPSDHRGVVIANEVLDALPVERFVVRNGTVMQVCVAVDDESFVWQERVARDTLQSAVADIEEDLGSALVDGYCSEVALAMPAMVADLANGLQLGAIFFFDYGVSRREYYAPQRNAGWLRCHFRHHAHDNPLINPGIQDLTTWVDFSAVAAAAVRQNLDILGYQAQAQFLLGGGLEDELRDLADRPLAEQLVCSNEIQTLTSPGEMGENFKCIAIGAGDVGVPSAFHLADRTKTL